MSILKYLGVSAVFALGALPTHALEKIYLSSDQQVHTLNVETSDDVLVTVNGDVFVQGFIKTDGNIRFEATNTHDSTGFGKAIRLNEGFIIDGYQEDAPQGLSFANLGAVYINTPIHVEGGFSVNSRSNVGDGNRLEINKDMDVGSILALIFPDGGDMNFNGTYVSGGVTVNVRGGIYNDNYGANFVVSGGAKVMADGIRVLAGNKKVVEGELISQSTVSIAGVGPQESYVKINKIQAINGESHNHFVEISGDRIDITGSVESDADNLIVNGKYEINLFDGLMTANRYIGISPSQQVNGVFNAYGGTLRANQVCLRPIVNDFGLKIEAAIKGC